MIYIYKPTGVHVVAIQHTTNIKFHTS